MQFDFIHIFSIRRFFIGIGTKIFFREPLSIHENSVVFCTSVLFGYFYLSPCTSRCTLTLCLPSTMTRACHYNVIIQPCVALLRKRNTPVRPADIIYLSAAVVDNVFNVQRVSRTPPTRRILAATKRMDVVVTLYCNMSSVRRT